MEPVSRLLETSSQVWHEASIKRHEELVNTVSEKMARRMSGSSHDLASPASITSMLAETAPEELFLPPKYGAIAASRSPVASMPTSVSLMNKLAAKQSDVMSLYKTDHAILRGALQQEPTLFSLVGPPSLNKVVMECEEDEGDDDGDEEEMPVID